MQGVTEQRRAVGELHHLSEVEDGQPVTEVLGDGEIVADENVGHAVLALEAPQQVQHLGLYRDV